MSELACKHGHLARVCEVCELETELAEAQSRLDAIEKAAQLPNCNGSHETIVEYIEELRAHALHLAAENARLREDAERYLYLRGLILFPTTMITVDDAFKDDPKLFDQAIDAVRKGKK